MHSSANKINHKDSPLIVPVFIPHEGCPHDCIFCNQKNISGQKDNSVQPKEVIKLIKEWLFHSVKKKTRKVEVAFYGGSFTLLPLSRQKELLQAVRGFIDRGEVSGVRLSTRPDGINRDVLSFLRDNKVDTIELGIQSLDDNVLTLSQRGHNSTDGCRAISLVQDHNFKLGVQLMLGLPGQSFTSLRQTVAKVVKLKPDFVRIYPLLVIKGTKLSALWQKGRYQPLSLDKGILQAAWMLEKFRDSGIKVIRVGLQPGTDLEKSLLAGPYHPSFGEMVASRIMFNKVRKLLSAKREDKVVNLSISHRDQSIFRGQKSVNIKRLAELGLDKRFILSLDSSLERNNVIIF